MLKRVSLLFSVLSVAMVSGASAADIYMPQDDALPSPAYELPPVQHAYAEGGWYLRGDINHHWSELRGGDYITYGPGTNSFISTDLDGAYSLGAGIGYQMNRHFRTDLTADYWFKSDFRGSTAGTGCPTGPCTSTDSSAYSALLLMANAYVDLGTYSGVTPYVGAGIGGAWVKWDELVNEVSTGTFRHEGGKEWRFAWSLMAGASYCLTDSLELDAGYRFTRIHGGRMFEYASGVGPGFDNGIDVHEARAGLRYAFGGPSANCAPQQVAYEPPAYEAPAEFPIYK